MLKLAQATTESEWIELLPGVRVELKPPTIAALLLAREAAGVVYRANFEAETKDPDVGVLAAVAMTQTYARHRISGWEGVGDSAGEPAPATPENIATALEHLPFFEAFDAKVLVPAFDRNREAAA